MKNKQSAEHRSLPRAKYAHKEQGWTLVELLVVILITGILASIAVVAFMAQRERAAEAQVISDVRNAATIMEDEYIDASRYPANLPTTAKLTDNSVIYNDITLSGPQNYCLIGTHQSYDDIEIRYDSLQGGLLERGQDCLPATEREDGSWGAPGGGDTWAEALENTTVLVIAATNMTDPAPEVVLERIGMDNVSVRLDITHLDQIREIDPDIVVAFGRNWNVPKAQLLRQAQLAGYSILTDGDDANRSHLPHMVESSATERRWTHWSETYPTYADVSPPFPYVFTPYMLSGGSDNYSCISQTTPSAVVVAAFQNPSLEDVECAAMIAQRDNGLWLHMIRAEWEEAQDSLTAGVLWLLS